MKDPLRGLTPNEAAGLIFLFGIAIMLALLAVLTSCVVSAVI